MRKTVIKLLILSLSICGLFGVLSINKVRALEIPNSVGGLFELTGASVRNSTSEEDLSGIRFTTNLSQKAYKDILTFANGKTVLFGTEIVPANNEKAEPVSIQYLSSNPKSGESKPKFKTSDDNEVIEYHASMTYNLDDFTNDLEEKLLVQGKLIKGEENYNNKLENYVLEYLKQAYAMQLKATSYFEIEYQRYYTGSIVRSMSMLANYYDKTPEYQKELTQYFYDKGYFTNGESKSGYVLENGNIVVDGFDMDSVVSLSEGYETLTFERENTLLSVKVNLPSINDKITLYAFDKDNKVTTLKLERVNEIPNKITVNNNDIESYVIAVDFDNEYALNSAYNLQSAISSKIGKNLEIVGLGTYDKAIVIKEVDKNETVDEGYKAYVESDNLIIECSYVNKLDDALSGIIDKIQTPSSNVVAFESDYLEVVDVSKVYYSDFGVIGDGVTNDFYAMKNAHDFANISGQTVYGENGKTYLITKSTDENNLAQVIDIKTNVNWMGAKIVIDDRTLTPNDPEITANVFNIPNEYETITINNAKDSNAYGVTISDIIPDKKIIKGVTNKVNNPFGFNALFAFRNNDRRIFMRSGSNANNGSWQQEICLVDSEGNFVDTNFLLDFDNITIIYVYRADTLAITVQNATIQTRMPQYNTIDGSNSSYARGINIERANTTLKNIEHLVTDELPNSDTYKGFNAGYLSTLNTYNILVEDCVFQGRVAYNGGTYDISPKNTHTITFKNCTQSNFFILDANGNPDTYQTADTSIHWGVMGSNGCKNLVYDGCILSRYDAHAGVVDGKIINSKVGQISVVGGGDLLIENTTIYARSSYVINLREDYGAFWDGTITIKDCNVVNSREDDPNNPGNTKYHARILKIVDLEVVNHNYGFTTKFPNLVIDNLKIEYKHSNVIVTNNYRLLYDPSITKEGALDYNLHANVNPYYPSEYVMVLNNEGNNYNVIVPTDNNFFNNTIVNGALKMAFSDAYPTDTPTETPTIPNNRTNFNPGWFVGDIIE